MIELDRVEGKKKKTNKEIIQKKKGKTNREGQERRRRDGSNK